MRKSRLRGYLKHDLQMSGTEIQTDPTRCADHFFFVFAFSFSPVLWRQTVSARTHHTKQNVNARFGRDVLHDRQFSGRSSGRHLSLDALVDFCAQLLCTESNDTVKTFVNSGIVKEETYLMKSSTFHCCSFFGCNVPMPFLRLRSCFRRMTSSRRLGLLHAF